MDNRIIDIRLESHAFDPATAEVRVTVTPLHLTPTTEVRGRLMGPSCPYASTVEVAYPLTPLRCPEPTPGSLRLRAVIPEPSLWDPQSPFLYAGPVELWQDGRRCDRARVRHGLRQLSLGPRGLRVNGRPVTLQGVSCETLFPEQATALRAGGCNSLLVPLRHQTRDVWETADRCGFLVLGRLEEDEEATAQLLLELQRHPCHLGCLAGPRWLTDGRLDRLAQALGTAGRPFLGLEVGDTLPRTLPPAVQFLAGCEEHLPDAAGPGLPLLLFGGRSPQLPDKPEKLTLLGRMDAADVAAG